MLELTRKCIITSKLRSLLKKLLKESNNNNDELLYLIKFFGI